MGTKPELGNDGWDIGIIHCERGEMDAKKIYEVVWTRQYKA